MKILCVFGRHAYGDAARGTGYEYANFIPSLRALGHDVDFFESFDRSAWSDFADLNRHLLDRVLAWQPEVVLFVLMGYEVWSDTLDLVKLCSSARLVNWSTDDSWKYAQFSRLIADRFDLYVTTCAAAFERAPRDGFANFMLSQWAAGTESLAEPLPSDQCRYDVTFVGAAYGNRSAWIADLRARGIDVECFGHGWPNGPVAAADVPAIMRGSRISLNFADSARMLIGWRFVHNRQIKARTFEVPGAGGCLFTESADDLARYYEPDREIVVFDNADDLAARIRTFLQEPARRDAVAAAGHRRTLRDHTYELRFRELLQRAGDNSTDRRAPRIDAAGARERMNRLVAAHRIGPVLRVLRAVLVAPFVPVWGWQRGSRAARRLLFELSWRIAGARTYSAKGLPGRLFYRES